MESTDPRRNFVLFALGPDPGDALPAEVRAEDGDAIRRAWRQVAAEHDVRAGQITQIHADWQPSTMDIRYIEATFDDVEVTYVFPRPRPDGWPAALAEAREVIEETLRAEEEDDEALVLPVLRSAALPDAGGIIERLPSWFVVEERIYVTMARTAMTPRGTVGMRHLTNHDVTDDEFPDRMVEAVMALSAGLRVETLDTDDGEMLRLTRDDGFAAGAAFLLPDFHRRISGLRGWTELVVAIFDPDVMFVAPEGSACAQRFRRDIAAAEQETPEFLPSLLRITADGRELLAEAR